MNARAVVRRARSPPALLRLTPDAKQANELRDRITALASAATVPRDLDTMTNTELTRHYNSLCVALDISDDGITGTLCACLDACVSQARANAARTNSTSRAATVDCRRPQPLPRSSRQATDRRARLRLLPETVGDGRAGQRLGRQRLRLHVELHHCRTTPASGVKAAN